MKNHRKMNPIPLISVLLVLAVIVFVVMAVFYARLKEASDAATSTMVTTVTETTAETTAETTTTTAETTTEVTTTTAETTTMSITTLPAPEIKAVDLEHPYLLEVNKTAQIVTIYTLDQNGKYTVPVRYMICSTGERSNTPEGLWTLKTQYRWRMMVNGEYAQYATRITGNFLIHSLPYSKTDINTMSADEYNKLGTPSSLGCVRLQAADAKWVYDNMKPGSYVRIIKGTAMPEIKKSLQPDPLPKGKTADPSDPELPNPIQVKGFAILATPYPGVTPAPMTEKLSDELTTKAAATPTPTATPEETPSPDATPDVTPDSTTEPSTSVTTPTSATEPATSPTETSTTTTTTAAAEE